MCIRSIAAALTACALLGGAPAQADEATPGFQLETVAPEALQRVLRERLRQRLERMAPPEGGADHEEALSATFPDGMVVARSVAPDGRVRLEYENGFVELRGMSGYQVYAPDGTLTQTVSYVTVPGQTPAVESLDPELAAWLEGHAGALLGSIRTLGGGAETEANYLALEQERAGTIFERIALRSQYLSMMIGF